MTKSQYMLTALKLAKQALGRTSPNPMVGCVIVKNDKIIGRGWHHKAGLAHAEVNALVDAGPQASGADAYVTLEPCSSHGRTPPCSQALIDAKIKKVFIGCLDPHPEHSGLAIKSLEKAGIEVEWGIEEQKCFELNLPFFNWIKTKKPLVTLKMAMTLDGRIATKTGHSQWITGPAAREEVQNLRKRCDAIMVGGETFRSDDPSLTVREEDWSQQPKRFIWTRQQELPQEAKACKDDGAKAQAISLSSKSEWENFLTQLGQSEITNLLIEGGGELAAQALESNIVDEVIFFIAPKILGGHNSRPVIAGKDPISLEEALQLFNTTMRPIGDDFLLQGFTKPQESFRIEK